MFEKLHGSKWSRKTIGSDGKNSGSCHDCRALGAIKPPQDPLGNLEVGWDRLSEEVIFGLNPSVNWWESALRPFVFVNVLCLCVLVHFCRIWMEVNRGDRGRPLGTLSCFNSLTFAEDKCGGRRHSWQLLLFESIQERAWVKANCSRFTNGLKMPCFHYSSFLLGKRLCK